MTDGEYQKELGLVYSVLADENIGFRVQSLPVTHRLESIPSPPLSPLCFQPLLYIVIYLIYGHTIPRKLQTRAEL